MSEITTYCLGFAFDPTLQQVALIQKNRPDFLKGRWTGVGGHVEEGETAGQAMAREFEEEANVGTSPDRWVHLGEFGRGANERLDVFAITMDLTHVRSLTEEPVQVFGVEALPPVTAHGRMLTDFIALATEALAGEVKKPTPTHRTRRSP